MLYLEEIALHKRTHSLDRDKLFFGSGSLWWSGMMTKISITLETGQDGGNGRQLRL